MNYYDIKFLHITFVIIFIASQASLFISSKKLHKIIAGISSLFIIIFGFILLGRYGIKHSGPYPFWVSVKLIIWFILSVVFPILFKRFQSITKFLYIPWLLLLLLAGFMAIYKY
jgi:uncharacterized membrane protein